MPSENYIVVMTIQEQPKVFLYTGDLKMLTKQCRHEVAQDGRVSIHSLEQAKFQPKMAFDGIKLQQVSLLISHEDPEELLRAFIETTEVMDEDLRMHSLEDAIEKLHDEIMLQKTLEKEITVENNNKSEQQALPSNDNPT